MTPSAPLVALVTAGSAGLGAATARLFARSGMRVAINYNTDDARAATLVADLYRIREGEGEDADVNVDVDEDAGFFCAIKADLGRRDDVERLVAEAARAMGGRLDVVFSNGGWTRLRRIHDLDDNMDDEDWDRCFAVNVKSHLWLMHAARPFLEPAAGVFITTASTAGLTVTGSSMVCLCSHRRDQRDNVRPTP